jgi:hypothetical protein
VALDPDRDLELPAIVIGRRCETEDLHRVEGAPWLAAFVHQCGGYSCMQEPIVGIVLPLAWNVGPEDAPWRVVHGLAALAADSPSSARVVRLPVDLEGLHLTAGRPYHRGQLDVLADFVAQAFRLPRPIRGVEALVELAECDLKSVFEGWCVLSTEAARDMSRSRRFVEWQYDVARARARWDRETVLDQVHLDALASRLGDAGIGGSLKAFLVWGNSD